MPASELKILFLTANFPYPLIGGERVKQYHIIKRLAKNNKVFVVGLDRGLKINDKNLDEFKSQNVIPYVFKINELRAYINAAIFSLFGKPMEAEFFRHKKFGNKINEILANNNIDIVINFFLRTAEYARKINLPKILVLDDCRSRYQYNTYKSSKNLKERLIRRRESRKLKKYESDITNDFNITTLVTEEDLKCIRALNHEADLRILSHGVDLNKFCPPNSNSQRTDLLFLGKLDEWVNILMVKKIVKEIYPGIKRVLPKTRLILAGANPTREIKSFASDGIIIKANLENIMAELQNAVAFIHPHSGGSGIQNKVLEAMACGCPVITTPSGAQGIKIKSGFNGYIANSNKEFINFAVNLLINPNLGKQIGANARKYVEIHHDWNNVLKELDTIIDELI